MAASCIGQQFDRAPQYFHPRPVGRRRRLRRLGAARLQPRPDEPRLPRLGGGRVAAYREENGLAADALVPVDAVTASASGLDPDISVANAGCRPPGWPRPAGIAGRPTCSPWSTQHTTGRPLGFLGEPGVNVLELNLALDGTGDGRRER